MLLALDTATSTASLALYDLETDRLLGEWTWEARRRQTQDLLDAASTLLAKCAAAPDDLTALAVTTGPGSFTGVRIGVSTVKGIALGLSEPPRVVGVPTLCVTAAAWLRLAAHAHAAVWPYIQAGRGRYNWARLTPQEPPRLQLRSEEHEAGTAADFVAALADQDDDTPLWLAGELDEDLSAALADVDGSLPHVTVLDAVTAWRRAGALARLAAQALAAGADQPVSALQPLYLRPPT